jgi:hypothetical protein
MIGPLPEFACLTEPLALTCFGTTGGICVPRQIRQGGRLALFDLLAIVDPHHFNTSLRHFSYSTRRSISLILPATTHAQMPRNAGKATMMLIAHRMMFIVTPASA